MSARNINKRSILINSLIIDVAQLTRGLVLLVRFVHSSVVRVFQFGYCFRLWFEFVSCFSSVFSVAGLRLKVTAASWNQGNPTRRPSKVHVSNDYGSESCLIG